MAPAIVLLQLSSATDDAGISCVWARSDQTGDRGSDADERERRWTT